MKTFRKFLFGNVGGTVIQILILVLVLPGILLIAHTLAPTQTGNLISGILSEIPYLGKLTDIVQYASSVHGNWGDGLLHILSALIETINENTESAMIIGMCVLLGRELSILIGLRGLPVIGVVFGSIIGILVNIYFLTAESIVPILILVFLVVLNIVVILISELGGQWAQKIIGILFMAVHGIIAALFLFYILCIVYMVQYGVSSWQQVLAMGLIPLITLLAAMLIDYFLGCAKRSFPLPL